MNSMEIVNKALAGAGVEAEFPYEHKVLFALIMDAMLKKGWNLALTEVEKLGGDIKGLEKKEENIK